MMMGMETRSTTVVQNNKTINNSNVSMRLFGSTGEPDGATMESGTKDS